MRAEFNFTEALTWDPVAARTSTVGRRALNWGYFMRGRELVFRELLTNLLGAECRILRHDFRVGL